MSTIHITTGDGQAAEYDEDQVRTMLQQGLLRDSVLYWKEGMSDWQPLSSIFGHTSPTATVSCVNAVHSTRPSRFSIRNLVVLFGQLILWCFALLAICIVFSALSAGFGGYARLPSMLIILAAELILAFLVYFVMRKIVPRAGTMLLVVIPCLVGLVAGWYVGYRMASAQWAYAQWVQATEHLQRVVGREISESEKEQIWSQILADPARRPTTHAIAVHNSIPACVMVITVIFSCARRRHNKPE